MMRMMMITAINHITTTNIDDNDSYLEYVFTISIHITVMITAMMIVMLCKDDNLPSPNVNGRYFEVRSWNPWIVWDWWMTPSHWFELVTRTNGPLWLLWETCRGLYKPRADAPLRTFLLKVVFSSNMASINRKTLMEYLHLQDKSWAWSFPVFNIKSLEGKCSLSFRKVSCWACSPSQFAEKIGKLSNLLDGVYPELSSPYTSSLEVT